MENSRQGLISKQMCHAVNIWWLFPMCGRFIQLVIVKCQNHECKSINSFIQRLNRVATRAGNFRHLKTCARSITGYQSHARVTCIGAEKESGVRFLICEIFPFYLCEVSFNLRIGSHKKLSCATLKCKTNFNDRQRRNEV